MNTVFITGIILDKPLLRQEQSGAQHLVFRLGVRHRTASGEWRKEVYKVSAWHKAAQWGADNLEKGELVNIQGYLTQHQVKTGEVTFTYVEIAAEEFMRLKMDSGAKACRGITEPERYENESVIAEVSGAPNGMPNRIPEVPSVESEYPIA